MRREKYCGAAGSDNQQAPMNGSGVRGSGQRSAPGEWIRRGAGRAGCPPARLRVDLGRVSAVISAIIRLQGRG